MSTFSLVLKEIRQRKGSALLVVLAVAVATGTVLTVVALNRILSDEVRGIMRDMGTNLYIFPTGVRLDHLYHGIEPGPETMPETYIDELLAQRPAVARHLVGKLSTTVEINGRDFLLTGVSPERDVLGGGKTQLGMVISPKSIHLGVLAGEDLDWQVGQTVTLRGRTFRVEEIRPGTGTRDDYSIFAPLAEVQEMLGKPGRLNSLEALGCLCEAKYLSDVKKKLEETLPGTRVVTLRSIWVARYKARRRVAHFGRILALMVVALSAAGAAASFLVNVQHRRAELGILRAMGCRTTRVAGLFLLKALVLGMVAAGVAYLGAIVLVRVLTPGRLGWPVPFEENLLLWSFVFAPVLGLLVSLPAVCWLTRLDPADVLREV